MQRKLKITTAQIILTSLGNAISGRLSGRDFSKFSVHYAPTDGGAPLRSGGITYFALTPHNWQLDRARLVSRGERGARVVKCHTY